MGYLLIVFQVSLTKFLILLKFVLKRHILFKQTLLLILSHQHLHLHLLKLSLYSTCLLGTLFSPEVQTAIDSFPLLLQHSNISFFLPDQLLNSIGLHIFVIPRTQSIDILQSLLRRAMSDVGREELIDE